MSKNIGKLLSKLGIAMTMLGLLAIQGCQSVDKNSSEYPVVNSAGPGVYPSGSFVAKHGQLRVEHFRLCDEAGTPVILKGLSTKDLKYYNSFVNDDGVSFLAENWNVTVLRASMYVDSYIENKGVERYVDNLVDACEKSGIYCIIDWHVLGEKNPLLTTDAAKAFFARKAQQYAEKKHVIYEICNEPNGDDVKWDSDVKPYAEAVIPVIRRYAPDAVVIVGTPTWSQDVDIAAKSPLAFYNVMYAFHFYAGTHGSDVKAKLRATFDRIPVFCSEWGPTNADGDGGPFPSEADSWLSLVESMGISWCDWSLSDAEESSAILKPGASPKGGWTDDDLKPSGLYVKSRLLR